MRSPTELAAAVVQSTDPGLGRSTPRSTTVYGLTLELEEWPTITEHRMSRRGHGDGWTWEFRQALVERFGQVPDVVSVRFAERVPAR